MSRPHINSTSLMGAMIAALFALNLFTGAYSWLASIAGLMLLLVLLSYDEEGHRSLWQSLAYGAVCGFCACVALASLFWRLTTGNGAAETDRVARYWLPLACAAATFIFWAIDRARMAGRAPASAPTSLRNYTPTQPQSAPMPVVRPAAMATSSIMFTPEPVVSAAPESPPEPVSTPVPIPAKPGKETAIYVNLTGEAMNVLRSVRAEHLGRDFYKIIEEMPDNEKWEYGPGQVVRARKKNLSSGKALVAYEEAPRAQ